MAGGGGSGGLAQGQIMAEELRRNPGLGPKYRRRDVWLLLLAAVPMIALLVAGLVL